MQDVIHKLLDGLIMFGGAALIWVGGEAGRTAIAGGAGALVRWWASERRGLRNGVIQALTGALVATYMWPLIFGILQYFIPGLEKDTETIAASSFIAGMLGMSVAKIAVALVENFAKQNGPDRTDRGGGHD